MAVVKSPKNSKRRILWIKQKSFLILKSLNKNTSYSYKNILKFRKKSLLKLKKKLLKYPKDRSLDDPYIIKFDFGPISLNFFNNSLISTRNVVNSRFKKISIKRMEKKSFFLDSISYFV